MTKRGKPHPDGWNPSRSTMSPTGQPGSPADRRSSGHQIPHSKDGAWSKAMRALRKAMGGGD